MSNTAEHVTKSELRHLLHSQNGAIVMFMAPVLIFGIYQLIMHGIEGADSLFLIFGSILTYLSGLWFELFILESVASKIKFSRILLYLSYAIPLIFCSYLVFYKGLWSLFSLRFGFSVFVTIEALVFAYLGYKTTKVILLIKDVIVDVKSGKIDIASR